VAVVFQYRLSEIGRGSTISSSKWAKLEMSKIAAVAKVKDVSLLSRSTLISDFNAV
jgi:hypothetical protein